MNSRKRTREEASPGKDVALPNMSGLSYALRQKGLLAPGASWPFSDAQDDGAVRCSAMNKRAIDLLCDFDQGSEPWGTDVRSGKMQRAWLVRQELTAAPWTAAGTLVTGALMAGTAPSMPFTAVIDSSLVQLTGKHMLQALLLPPHQQLL